MLVLFTIITMHWPFTICIRTVRVSFYLRIRTPVNVVNTMGMISFDMCDPLAPSALPSPGKLLSFLPTSEGTTTMPKYSPRTIGERILTVRSFFGFLFSSISLASQHVKKEHKVMMYHFLFNSATIVAVCT